MKKRYAYDLHGNVRKVIDAGGMETGETDEEWIGALYAYNYAGWLTESHIPMKLEEGEALYYREESSSTKLKSTCQGSRSWSLGRRGLQRS